jgi:hyperosmotically inducible periplasmic protein
MRTVCFVFVVQTSLIMAAQPPGQNTQHNDPFIPGNSDENRIAKEVRHELVMLPYYGIFDDLGFTVQNGTVTLYGAVVRPILKSDAENVVKRVEGVSNVENKIEVLPPSSLDDQIRMAEYRAIYGDPAISTRYGYRALPSIHIIVRNGHVTLEGMVATKGDKDLINVKANGVPNVFSVDNRLQVESQERAGG